jgi:hypothetical protein
LTPLHFVKIGLSLIAVTLAVICSLWVFRRRGIEDENSLLGYRRRIWTLAAVATLFCVARTLSRIGVFRPLIGYFALAVCC